MKSLLNLSMILVLFVITGFTFSEDSNAPVVVELFTAEGCSSCPPADDLLKEMSDILNKEGKFVVGLSFHVTYWNNLGWEDPYSKEEFTKRQKKYGGVLKAQTLYTPQAVVNGAAEFVGSNPMAFRDLVTKASEKPYTYALHGEVTSKGDQFVLDYDLGKDPKNTVMNIAIVENFVQHYIPRGENKDRNLKHTNVVRSFETVTPQKSGEIVMSLPSDFKADKFTIVVYTQNTRNLSVSGATVISMIK